MALIGITQHTAADSRPAPRRRSRAKVRPARAYEVICVEARGLSTLVLEQALLAPDEAPVASICEWANRLAAEFGVEGVGTPKDYRALLHALVDVTKRAAHLHGTSTALACAA
jgi:hypothetical protein